MIRTSGNLVIPIVTWAPTPPLHRICCILASDDGKDVVTGGIDGNMVLWSVCKDGTFAARWMITGHRSPVRHLCLAGSRSDENSRIFFSHSSGSEMALWNWQDGKCTEFKIDTRHQHTTIKSHQPAFLDYRLLFCSGRYPHIAVLHATSLSVLFTLASQSHSDWLSSFVVFTHPNQKHEIVLGLSYSNMVTLWTLSGEEVQGEANYEHESRAIECSSPVLQVHCCPQTPRCVLLVTSFGWQLLDAMTCSVFCSQPNPSSDPLVGGQFVHSNLMAIYCRSGITLLYRVTPRVVTGSQPGSSASLNTDPPILLARLYPHASEPSDPTSGRAGTKIPGKRGRCCFSLAHESPSRPLLFGGTDWGSVVSWRLDRFLAPDTVSQDLNFVPPTMSCDLASLWRRHSPQRFLDLWEKDQRSTKGLATSCDTITACVQILQMGCPRPQNNTVLHPGRLAFGLSNGRIVVVRLIDFLQLAYWQSSELATGLLKFSRFCLDGHEGPVTSLLHPASAEDHCVRTFAEMEEDRGLDRTKTPSSNMAQFNPDHLLSGGADFTVRLWDLDPWRDVHVDRMRSSTAGTPGNELPTDMIAPACLAVFRCHASPCVALTLGPLSTAVMQTSAGNPRLSACVCSIGSDGSVSVISLREQRVLLSTTPCNSLSSSPVTALGWRVPEDILFVAHADGQLEMWDITVGCLDRLETDSTARDLFEQAHFVLEVQSSSASFSSSLPLLSYQSGQMAAHHSRSNTLVFVGSANSSHAAGSVGHTAPARLRRTPHLHQLPVPHGHPAPVLLQSIGVTVGEDSKSTSADSLSAGPSAFVFHWDTEAIIANLLAENVSINGSADKNSVDELDAAAKVSGAHCSTLVKLVQLFVSFLHPWGLDPESDEALLACAGLDDGRGDKTRTAPRIQTNLCIGLISRHGCLSLCMPGWSSLDSVGQETRQYLTTRLYSLSHGISTNLMLAELSLCETLSSLDPDYAEQLFLLLTERSRTKQPLSVIIGAGGIADNSRQVSVRANWIQLASRLCGPLLARFVSETGSGSGCCFPELEMLVQKWQDRMIPIRYAARTLLCAYLDHIGHANRQFLVSKWSSILPAFALSQSINQSQATTAHADSNGSPSLSRPHPQAQATTAERKQSLQAQLTTAALDRRLSNSAMANGNLPHSNPASPHRGSQQSTAAQGLPAVLQSVSLCSLDSSSGQAPLHSVTDSHWWLTLSGYRVSAHEHARLQAIAIILLGVIGSRFGSGVQRRHPAVAIRDLIDDSKPIYQLATAQTDSSSASTTTARNPGLASPCFASPDTPLDPKEQQSATGTRDLTIEDFAPPLLPQPGDAVLDGFGYDNYQLARATCQCLTALLFNRAPMLDASSDNVSSPSTVGHTLPLNRGTGPSAAAANALVSLLMANPHSSLRRAAIDLLGRGFIVWEPYVDLGHILNALLHLVANAEQLLSGLSPYQSIPDRVDLARTAREAIWAIGFARPKSLILVLSLEVRRYGAQINAAAATAASSTPSTHHFPLQKLSSLSHPDALTSTTTVGPADASALPSVDRRDSSTLTASATMPPTPRMMVMMASPAVAAPVFAPPLPVTSNAPLKSPSDAGSWPPIFTARDEIVRLCEQLCVRRANDVISVLPEIVEVVLACLDRTRLKERGLDFVFPALRQFSAFSSHTRLQKACVGGVNGSLTFFDFKIGRYCVSPGHKGPVTAVRFHSDGRLIASYSLTESVLRIWQLHTTGFFGMGGQQVKAVSTHPVPPLLPPPKHLVPGGEDGCPAQTPKDSLLRADYVSADAIPVWLDWPEARVVHLITDSGVKRRVNI